MQPWRDSPVVSIDTALPFGAAVRDLPAGLRAAGHELAEAMTPEAELIPKWLAPALAIRTRRRYHAEARAWASVLDQRWQDILSACCAYDLIVGFFGCSTVLVEGARGPALARNMDWWPERELARASCLLRFEREGRPLFWNAGWPGSIGVVSGMSARGFAVVLNAVTCDERPHPLGIPVMLWVRDTLERARGFNDAVRRLTKKKLAASCLLGVVGSENRQRVVIERTPTGAAQRWGTPGRALVVTNDYRRLRAARKGAGSSELGATACGRFDRLTEMLAADPPDGADEQALLSLLSDADVRMGITAQQMVFHPASETVRLTAPARFFE